MSEERIYEQTALSGRGGAPADLPLTQTEISEHVSLVDPPTIPNSQDNDLEEASQEPDAFADLFDKQNQPLVTPSWTPRMLAFIKAEVRLGLNEKLRNKLLSDYRPKEDLAFLTPPKVNKGILPNLGATVLARDKHQIQSQAQLGASLKAIGSGMSDILGSEAFRASAENKTAVTKIADGLHLLADLHFRLSQSRRAFIVLSLNFLGKTASDSAPIDDCLFGSNFAEDVNAAQTVEKVARKMARKPPQTQKQQMRQPSLQRAKPHKNQPLRDIQPNQENYKPPLRKTQAAHRSRRGSTYPNRSRRSPSRSRARSRR
ncbi:hypothetical protein ALC57_05478 [Trachymyrmex cornetzi]|uniref:Uncharacterized protein n=1 Tax=Trachymyrmex cornetzi TaxID=471704 RepID=A0A151JAQ5_9HYME|nr:hypothetical protein ALC57_05478 [Trachymyrmex cornetzi]